MNISYNWLRRYLDFDLDATQTAALLTSIGLEVDGTSTSESIRGGLNGLVVGHVLECQAHPNSDHLHVTKVDVGTGTPLQIVCGAPNVAAGQNVIVATLGTVLYDGDKPITIKPSKLRGVASEGMICAEDEIGVGSDHSGIIVLDSSLRPGTPAKNVYHVDSDTMIEVDITPNRADAASHWGVARDLYAALRARGLRAELQKPPVEAFAVDEHSMHFTVEVRNEDACPRYSGVCIDGVTIAPSPDWLQKALRSIGLNPINNVVDVSNYILFGLGQPLHTFDADQVAEGRIIVENCPEGTPFTTLDGVERKLSCDDLMICSPEGPMCIAGVFGGLKSGISEHTHRVFIESAWFNPVCIRKTARRHQLSTDASFRYERGTDPDNVIYALKQAALLIKQVAGGRIASDIIDVYPHPVAPFEVDFSRRHCHKLIGKTLNDNILLPILESLEMRITSDDGDVLHLQVPRYRVDVTREADVVEDVLRIHGYDNVELPGVCRATLLNYPKPDAEHVKTTLCDFLASRGFQEIMNNTLTRAAYSELLPDSCPAADNVMIINPLSADLNALRQSLVFGALETVRFNRNHRNYNLRLFELGNVQRLRKTEDKGNVASYDEATHLSLLLTGLRAEPNWTTPSQTVSFPDLKAEVMALLDRAGLDQRSLTTEEIHNDLYAEGLALKVDKTHILATLGHLNAELLKGMDVDAEVYYAELSVPLLLNKVRQQNKVHYTTIARYPEVRRDLALLVDDNVSFAQIEQTARKAEKKLLRQVDLFDVYQGTNLPAGKKSYAVSFILRDDERTLTDKQIEHTMTQITAALVREVGAEQR